MLPVVAGRESTRRHILAYTLVLAASGLQPVGRALPATAYGMAALLGPASSSWPPAVARRSDADGDADLPLLDRLPVPLLCRWSSTAPGLWWADDGDAGASEQRRQRVKNMALARSAGPPRRAVLPDHHRQDEWCGPMSGRGARQDADGRRR